MIGISSGAAGTTGSADTAVPAGATVAPYAVASICNIGAATRSAQPPAAAGSAVSAGAAIAADSVTKAALSGATVTAGTSGGEVGAVAAVAAGTSRTRRSAQGWFHPRPMPPAPPPTPGVDCVAARAGVGPGCHRVLLVPSAAIGRVRDLMGHRVLPVGAGRSCRSGSTRPPVAP